MLTPNSNPEWLENDDEMMDDTASEGIQTVHTHTNTDRHMHRNTHTCTQTHTHLKKGSQRNFEEFYNRCGTNGNTSPHTLNL